MTVTRHFIGGSFVEASGPAIDNVNPSTGAVIGSVAIGTDREVDAAVTAAQRALDAGWSTASGAQRRIVMTRLARLIAERASVLSAVASAEMGMPAAFTLGEAFFAAEWLDYFAGWADKIEGAVVPVAAPAVLDYTLREPVGVAAAIVPWNSPLSLSIFKLAPALAAGNAMVFKPSELAPGPVLALMELAAEAGVPAGVIGCVTGDGTTGAALVEHEGVGAVAFTGGTETGRAVAAACGRRLKRCTLELGGKSANIVFPDADLEAAAAQSVAACFVNSGQQCIAGSRLLVHRSISDDFTRAVVGSAAGWTMGDASRPDVQLGPVISEAALRRSLEVAAIAQGEGAELLAGGRRAEGDGFFLAPTVLGGVRNDMRVARDEIFGPVLSVIAFADEEEAVRMANDSPFGLAAGVWTNDLSTAHRTAGSLRAGTVWVNAWLALNPGAPFGGYKASGLGREGGKESLAHYTQTKNVYVQMKP